MHTKCPECNLEFTPESHEDEIKTLRAENARYREALEKISCPTSMWDGFNAKMYWDIARKTLRGE